MDRDKLFAGSILSHQVSHLYPAINKTVKIFILLQTFIFAPAMTQEYLKDMRDRVLVLRRFL